MLNGLLVARLLLGKHDRVLELGDLGLEHAALHRERGVARVQVGDADLRVHRLGHAQVAARAVQRQVAHERHAQLVARAQQHEPSLGALDRHLPDQLVEQLGEELLAHRADPARPRLQPREPLIERAAQRGDVLA